MIPIKKGDPPEVLLDKGKTFQVDAVEYYNDPENCASDFTANFKKYAVLGEDDSVCGFESKLFSLYSFYSDPSVKSQLILEHKGKCAFCESFIMDTDVGDVEHYRPKAEVSEVDPNNTSQERPVPDHPGYFWLSQSWENLFLSCKQCNQAYKRTRFDVVPSGQGSLDKDLKEDFPRLSPGQAPDPKKEIPMLLYPGADSNLDPRDVIKFDPKTAEAKAVQGGVGDTTLNQSRAGRTIELVGLNRERLIEARAAHLLHLRGLFVLAAIGGGYVEEQKDKYSIFDFAYDKECAGKDAQTALGQAREPEAEFSALAIDAIEAWNAELKLQEHTVDLANKTGVKVHVQVNLDLRLEEHAALLAKSRKASESLVDREAEPDTYDLDVNYNDLLSEYKRIAGEVAKKRKTIETALKDIDTLKKEQESLDKEWEESDDPVFAVQEKISKLEKADRIAKFTLALVSESDRISQLDSSKWEEEIGKKEQNERGPLRELVNDKNLRESTRQKNEKTLEQNEEERKGLNKELDDLEKKREPLKLKKEALGQKIEKLESSQEKYSDQLLELNEDIVDVETGYESSGAKDRLKRAKNLKAAINNLGGWLDGEEELSDEVEQHFKKKGWPPRITKL